MVFEKACPERSWEKRRIIGARALLLSLGLIGVGCAPEPSPSEGEGPDGAGFLAASDPCTATALTTKGSADGVSLSLAKQPLSCDARYVSSSTTMYGSTGCDGYIVELSGVAALPRAGETLRIADGVNPRLFPLLNETDCKNLYYSAHAYIHTTDGGWSAYGAHHSRYGSWNGGGCTLLPDNYNGEIPPFPPNSGRDKIRVVASLGLDFSPKAVSLGVRAATCPPTALDTGAACDADDQCKSAFCAHGSCCGSSAAAKKACQLREVLGP